MYWAIGHMSILIYSEKIFLRIQYTPPREERLQLLHLDSIKRWKPSHAVVKAPLLCCLTTTYVHPGTNRHKIDCLRFFGLAYSLVLLQPTLIAICLSSVYLSRLAVHPSAWFSTPNSSLSPLLLDSVALTLPSDSASAALVPLQVVSPPRLLYMCIDFPVSWKLLAFLMLQSLCDLHIYMPTCICLHICHAICNA